MKKISIILFILFIISDLHSQEKVVAVATSFFNILYIGVDNPLEVAVEGMKDKHISVSVNKGTVKKVGNGQYVVNVNKPGYTKICISAKGKVLECEEYKCINVPDPIPFLSSGSIKFKTGSILKQHLLAMTVLRAENISEVDFRFIITSFIVSAKKGEIEQSAKSDFSKFTNEQKKIIQDAKRGSEIIIKEIRCVGQDKKERKLKDIILTIQ